MTESLTTGSDYDPCLLLAVLAALALVGLMWGLVDTRRVVGLPFLFGAGLLVYTLPQVWIIISNSPMGNIPGLELTLLYVAGCTLAAYAGYFTYKPERPRFRVIFNQEMVFTIGLTVAALGCMGSLLLMRFSSSAANAETLTEGWHGWPVYYYTLSTLVTPGISLLLIAYLIKSSKVKLLTVLIVLYFPLQAMILDGRRNVIFSIPFCIGAPLILLRGVRIPRWLPPIVLVLALPVIYLVPVYRDSFRKGEAENAWRERPVGDEIRKVLQGETGLEFQNTIAIIKSVLVTGQYGYGSAYYNALVQQFVPGTLIGPENKKKLFVNKRDYEELELAAQGGSEGEVRFYTAKSGFADTFTEFGFFGILVFFGLGRIYGLMTYRAFIQHNAKAVLFLCFFGLSAASVVYEETVNLVAYSAVQFCIYLAVCRWGVVAMPWKRRSVENGSQRRHAPINRGKPSESEPQAPQQH
jgi:hypothetical protein